MPSEGALVQHAANPVTTMIAAIGILTAMATPLASGLSKWRRRRHAWGGSPQETIFRIEGPNSAKVLTQAVLVFPSLLVPADTLRSGELP
jgi:hypothetical protein